MGHIDINIILEICKKVKKMTKEKKVSLTKQELKTMIAEAIREDRKYRTEPGILSQDTKEILNVLAIPAALFGTIKLME